MSEPPWKQLVDALKAREFESAYLDRLTARMRAAHRATSLEEEILEEMASALKRSEDIANLALLELDVLEDAYQKALDDQDRAEQATAFNSQWDRARRKIWEYRVHREAIGLRWSDEVDQMFPLPRRKRTSGTP